MGSFRWLIGVRDGEGEVVVVMVKLVVAGGSGGGVGGGRGGGGVVEEETGRVNLPSGEHYVMIWVLLRDRGKTPGGGQGLG